MPLAVGAAASVLAGRAAFAQSTDWMQPGNNNHSLKLQNTARFPSGAVGFDFYGNCALKLTSPAGATVLFDPWRDDPSGAWGKWFKNKFPETVVDITMSTHAHFDHDAIDRPQSTMVLDRMIGEYAFADLKITGFAEKHVCEAPGPNRWSDYIKEIGAQACPPNNPGALDNVMYLVETGGIRTLIWGDNRHNPADSFWKAVGRVDVLTIPVDDSEYLLSYAQIDAVVARLKPRAIIPTHYLSQATTFTLSTLQSADKWVAAQKRHRKLDGPSLRLTAAQLARMDRDVMYFGDHALLK